MAEVSICVAAYNAEQEICACLDSIIKQTFEDIEIIVVDDGSSDSTLRMINYYQELDSRIIVVHQENQGVSKARNRAVEMAGGRYIMFIDSDDRYEKDAVELLYENINSKHVHYVFGLYKTSLNEVPEKKKEIGTKTQIIDFWLNGSVKATLWRGIYIADIAKKCKFNNEIKYAEDLLWLLSYIRYAESYCYLDKVVYIYNVENLNSASSNKYSEKYVDSYIRLPNLIAGLLADNNYKCFRKVMGREFVYSAVRVKRSVGHKQMKQYLEKKEYRSGLRLKYAFSDNLALNMKYLAIYLRMYALYRLLE